MTQSSKTFWDRLFKIVVLVGTPILGWIYFAQHTGKSIGKTEVIIPFKVEKAPSLEGIKSLDNQSVTTSKWIDNKVSVVSFWATWCPPCVEELPAMAELSSRLSNAGVKFYFVSIDDSPKKVEKFLDDNVIDIPRENLYLDSGQIVASHWGSSKFPETYVVNPQGWMVEKIVGFQDWTRPSVFSYFENLATKYNIAMNNKIKKSTLSIAQAISFLVMPSAFAADVVAKNEPAKKAPETSAAPAAPKVPAAVPIIHEDDKKTLKKIQKNVETANKNVQKLEAAIRDEDRSLREVKIKIEREQRDNSEIEVQHAKIKDTLNEVEKVRKKNEDSLQAEKLEKERITKEIATLQQKQKDLEKTIEKTRDEIVLTNQNLSTRLQNIESFEKALTSSKDELKSLKDREKKTGSTLRDSSKGIAEMQKDYTKRISKKDSLQAEFNRWDETLNDEKQKLVEFERLLK